LFKVGFSFCFDASVLNFEADVFFAHVPNDPLPNDKLQIGLKELPPTLASSAANA